jgi:Ras-related protein Rab-8A
MLVYDVTQQESFQNIRQWIHDIHTHSTDLNINIMLIGNKCDMVNQKVIDTATGKALAQEYGIKFFETSAKADINVQESFNVLVKQVCDRLCLNPNVAEDEKAVDIRDGESTTKINKTCC